jgi:hypothetical protein
LRTKSEGNEESDQGDEGQGIKEERKRVVSGVGMSLLYSEMSLDRIDEGSNAWEREGIEESIDGEFHRLAGIEMRQIPKNNNCVSK